MHLVEQHRIDRIDRHDPRWMALGAATFASTHLYNAALEVTRQASIHEQRRVIRYGERDKLLQGTAEYRAVPAPASPSVLPPNNPTSVSLVSLVSLRCGWFPKRLSTSLQSSTRANPNSEQSIRRAS
jgi:hypothetical protein